MGSRRSRQRWCEQVPLTPLMEGPDYLDMHHDRHHDNRSQSRSWEVIREWFRVQRNINHHRFNTTTSSLLYGNIESDDDHSNNKPADLRLLLGVLGCPLAPIPLHIVHHPVLLSLPGPLLHIKDIPIGRSTAHYIIQQYLAATGCLKTCSTQPKKKNMYTAGTVRMICCETEISKGEKGMKIINNTGTNRRRCGSASGETNNRGCFVVWQMSPGMWSLELVVCGNKVVAGSDGKTVWRHTPWLGTHAAKGPQRSLRRIIQVFGKQTLLYLSPVTGLDPQSTAGLFEKAEWLGEKRIGEEDCFVLKVGAEREDVMERYDGPAEVIRHVLYGYFSQKSGLLVYMEDSHLTRVALVPPAASDDESSSSSSSSVYWETTIGSSIQDYREVDGLLIAHQGRSIATVLRFGGDDLSSLGYCRTRLEEFWNIDDVVFNVPGLSFDSFLPPADILHSP